VNTQTQKKKWIPDVSKERIEELAKKIKPIVTIAGKQRYIKPVDLFNIAFTWDPKPAFFEPKNLKPLRDITTYHRWAYYGFFKPSIAEVLAQIPAELLEEVVAFEIIEQPETADDFSKDEETNNAFNDGFHTAKTRLFSTGAAQ
jgi:hypothetical protein